MYMDLTYVVQVFIDVIQSLMSTVSIALLSGDSAELKPWLLCSSGSAWCSIPKKEVLTLLIILGNLNIKGYVRAPRPHDARVVHAQRSVRVHKLKWVWSTVNTTVWSAIR